MSWLLATLVCLLLIPLGALGQTPAVSRITIESSETGPGPSTHLKLVIQSRDGKKYLGENVIDSRGVETLLTALRSPVLTSPQAANLGITPEWLHQNAEFAPRNGAPNQQALFAESFSDRTTIDQVLPSCFKFLKFDDYPTMRVTVTLRNGQRWSANSDSYYAFMLPWRLNINGQEATTYNADISRAIAALMPIGSFNRDRLNDDELKLQLVDAVMTKIKNQWNLLGVESRAPGILAILQRDFEIEHAEISPYRGEDFGYVDGQPSPHENNLLASLRRSSLQGITAEEVVLLFHDGKVDGAENLAERMRPYEALALSVPWLNQYLADNPQQKVYIRFVHDRSFSTKAMQNFAADMRVLGKEFLANEVAEVQDRATLVFLDYGGYWIILPDERMILWRHYLPAGFLKWRSADFMTKRCADYNENGGGCVGAIISPDGKIQP